MGAKVAEGGFSGEIDATTRLRRKAEMVAADVADEAILLDIETGYFFQLNLTGARIWALLEAPMTLDQLCTRMGEHFRVDPETCRSDVTEFVADLLDRHVLKIDA